MNPAPENSAHISTLTRESLAAMSCSALVDFLIAETFEDAVFTFVGAISVFGITDRGDAIAAMEKDKDARLWAETTALMIPEPYEQNVQSEPAKPTNERL